ncbi:glycosyltransferase [Bacillus sp. 1P02SD]|uniref:glycosyltransferase n=1 Tax=Bacillus sp. 1P02SD TaxID=3132264 RepID=UPI0039A3442B
MKITACLITKNEENNIKSCLDSVKRIVDEIIVVDTGSCDQTIEIAKAYGAKLHQYEWKQDFAAARNFALSKAAGNWIIFLDADEYFDQSCRDNILNMIKLADTQKFDAIASFMNNVEKNSNNKTINSFVSVRIFRKDPNIMYRGSIHEAIYHTERELKVLDAVEVLKIIHTGYSVSEVKNKNKGQRNLELLLAELEHRPKDSDLCFYVSEAFALNGNYEESLNYAYKTIQYNNAKNRGVYQKNYSNMIDMMIALRYSKEIIKKTCLEAILKYPNYPDFYVFLGDIYRNDNQYYDAIETYNLAIENMQNIVISQARAHLNIDKILEKLGTLYYTIEEFNLCVKSYAEALKFNPYNLNALINMISILSKHEQNEAVVKFLSRIYDFASDKDILYLFKGALYSKNTVIAKSTYDLAKERFSKDIFTKLKSDFAYFMLLQHNYASAFEMYKELFNQTNDIKYRNKLLLIHLIATYRNYNPGEQRFDLPFEDATIINYFYTNEHVSLLSDDVSTVTSIIKDFCQLSEQSLLVDLFEKPLDIYVLFEIAECLHLCEDYNMALHFYKLFLQQGIEHISSSESSKTNVRIAECLKNVGNIQLALIYIEDAYFQNERSYYIFQLWIILCEKADNREMLAKVLKKAYSYHSDSNFIRQKMCELGLTL